MKRIGVVLALFLVLSTSGSALLVEGADGQNFNRTFYGNATEFSGDTVSLNVSHKDAILPDRYHDDLVKWQVKNKSSSGDLTELQVQYELDQSTGNTALNGYKYDAKISFDETGVEQFKIKGDKINATVRSHQENLEFEYSVSGLNNSIRNRINEHESPKVPFSGSHSRHLVTPTGDIHEYGLRVDNLKDGPHNITAAIVYPGEDTIRSRGFEGEEVSVPYSSIKEKLRDANVSDDIVLEDPTGFNVKTWNLTVPSDTEKDLNVSLNTHPEGYDEVYMYVLGSAGGATDIYSNSDITVYNRSHDPFKRNVTFNTDISSGTTLMIPYNVTDIENVSIGSGVDIVPDTLKDANLSSSSSVNVNSTEMGGVSWLTDSTTDGYLEWTLQEQRYGGEEFIVDIGAIMDHGTSTSNQVNWTVPSDADLTRGYINTHGLSTQKDQKYSVIQDTGDGSWDEERAYGVDMDGYSSGAYSWEAEWFPTSTFTVDTIEYRVNTEDLTYDSQTEVRLREGNLDQTSETGTVVDVINLNQGTGHLNSTLDTHFSISSTGAHEIEWYHSGASDNDGNYDTWNLKSDTSGGTRWVEATGSTTTHYPGIRFYGYTKQYSEDAQVNISGTNVWNTTGTYSGYETSTSFKDHLNNQCGTDTDCTVTLKDGTSSQQGKIGIGFNVTYRYNSPPLFGSTETRRAFIEEGSLSYCSRNNVKKSSGTDSIKFEIPIEDPDQDHEIYIDRIKNSNTLDVYVDGSSLETLSSGTGTGCASDKWGTDIVGVPSSALDGDGNMTVRVYPSGSDENYISRVTATENASTSLFRDGWDYIVDASITDAETNVTSVDARGNQLADEYRIRGTDRYIVTGPTSSSSTSTTVEFNASDTNGLYSTNTVSMTTDYQDPEPTDPYNYTASRVIAFNQSSISVEAWGNISDPEGNLDSTSCSIAGSGTIYNKTGGVFRCGSTVSSHGRHYINFSGTDSVNHSRTNTSTMDVAEVGLSTKDTTPVHEILVGNGSENTLVETPIMTQTRHTVDIKGTANLSTKINDLAEVDPITNITVEGVSSNNTTIANQSVTYSVLTDVGVNRTNRTDTFNVTAYTGNITAWYQNSDNDPEKRFYRVNANASYNYTLKADVDMVLPVEYDPDSRHVVLKECTDPDPDSRFSCAGNWNEISIDGVDVDDDNNRERVKPTVSFSDNLFYTSIEDGAETESTGSTTSSTEPLASSADQELNKDPPIIAAFSEPVLWINGFGVPVYWFLILFVSLVWVYATWRRYG